MTVVEAPPQPPPSHDELEALIEEARRRARRRRILVGGALVGAIAVTGMLAGLVLALRGGTGTAVPRGFHLVSARGPVRHLQLEFLLGQPATLDVATGDAKRTRVTQELWWNERTGFARTVYRQDGRVVSDWVEQQCQGAGASRFCIPPWPYLPYQQLRGPNEQPKPGAFRRSGTGTFRGHRVVWIETIYKPQGQKPSLGGDQVAYDAVTHRPLALRTIERSGRLRGRTFRYDALKLLPDLPPNGVSFVVPDGGAGRNPPNPLVAITGGRLDAAFAALGKSPLWLGRSFDGHRLTSVVTGRDGAVANGQAGRMLRPARFARFDYGSFSLKEFGQDRPWWYEQDPPAGKVVLSGTSLAFARDGVLVTLILNGSKFRLDRAKALELVRALQPVATG